MARRLMRRFCQLVLAACQAMIAVCRGHGGDGIACRFFSFLVSGGRGDGVSSRPVPRLVAAFRSYWRPVSRLVLSSRVGVPFVSRGLAFSCRRWRFASRSASRPVLSRRSVSSGVSCPRCLVAPFLSACVLVPSCLVLSCRRSLRARPAVRVEWRWVVVGYCGVVPLWRGGGALAVWRGVAMCGAWCRQFGDAVSCGVAWRAVSGTDGGTHGETHGEMRSETVDAPFLSARFGCSHVVITPRVAIEEFSAFSTVR